jgi:hypothetical protein
LIKSLGIVIGNGPLKISNFSINPDPIKKFLFAHVAYVNGKKPKNISKYNTFRVVLPYSGRLFCLTVYSHARDHLYTSATAAAGHEEPGETLTVRAGISG